MCENTILNDLIAEIEELLPVAKAAVKEAKDQFGYPNNRSTRTVVGANARLLICAVKGKNAGKKVPLFIQFGDKTHLAESFLQHLLFAIEANNCLKNGKPVPDFMEWFK